ncbi:asparagine synthetase domain-containing protein 1 [Plakobranchus ocellatus]|uniref:Asparagine synthetase domain-containing protein 1 n=1 Tax=Plakobranchus ocellatus TaxID=259542 RepID=A0AAV4AU36_9GAST|nr:asparagine synthetase domain-containing protein 1 [Plakobranchus ocellatus]
MCGICFVCSRSESHLNGQSCDSLGQKIGTNQNFLQNRGPDASSCSHILLPGDLNAFMQGCVLHLRGRLTPQPVTSSKGNILLWNGEIFYGIEVSEEENDTQVLSNMLDSCRSQESVLEVLEKIYGPWAFIFWQAEAKTLWFGRDMFGRRSLLWHLPETPADDFLLTSVALGDKIYKEIPCVGIFSMDFSHVEENTDGLETGKLTLPSFVLHPWLNCRWPGTNKHVLTTPAEDLISQLYPDGQGCYVNFSLSRYGLNRWIPVMHSDAANRHNFSKLHEEVSEACEAQNKLTKNADSEAGQVVTPELQAPRRNGSYEKAEANDAKSLEETLQQIFKERQDLHSLVEQCIETLQEAVKTRVEKLTHMKQLLKNGSTEQPCQESTARVAVLFSGGLDSTLLAALADRCVPKEEPIDLLNVAFEQALPPSPKQLGKCRKPHKQNRKTTRPVQPGAHGSDPDTEGSHESGTFHDAVSDVTHPTLGEENHLISAHSQTMQRIHPISAKDPKQTEKCAPRTDPVIPCVKDLNLSSSVNPKSPSVLNSKLSDPVNSTVFEPGRDSFCDVKDKMSPQKQDATSINQVSVSHLKHTAFDPYDVPDRQTGRTALAELNPNRQWNFVEINVSKVELQAVRQSHISQLIYPLRTVLDDSIGCAVWFAAKGLGLVDTDHPAEEDNHKKHLFSSRAQVVLCGMAADELFAGYSRHRATFNKEGWTGLEREMEEELWRISARNLGRDDRIITDHGKEARFPYLDEHFVQLVSKIPLRKRVDFTYPRGIGEKLLLRLCALKVGLAETACQAKRAIQFGSKIAKLDNRKEKGSDVCERLL